MVVAFGFWVWALLFWIPGCGLRAVLLFDFGGVWILVCDVVYFCWWGGVVGFWIFWLLILRVTVGLVLVSLLVCCEWVCRLGMIGDDFLMDLIL